MVDLDMDDMLEKGPDAFTDMTAKLHAMPAFRAYLLKEFKRVEQTGVMDF